MLLYSSLLCDRVSGAVRLTAAHPFAGIIAETVQPDFMSVF